MQSTTPLVTFYNGNAYSGVSKNYYSHGDFANIIVDGGWPYGQMVSVKVANNTTLTLYTLVNFTGLEKKIVGPQEVPNLLEWNGKAASFRVAYAEPTSADKVACCKGTGDVTRCGPYWPTSETAACDAVMAEHCRVTTDDPACACFVSEIPSAHCFDKRCTNSNAYKTKFMRENVAKCPTYMDCRQYIGLSDQSKNNILNNVQQTQICSVTQGGDGATSTTVKDTVTNHAPNAPPVAPKSDNAMMTLLVVLIIIVVGMALLMVVILSSDDTPEYEPYPYM